MRGSTPGSCEYVCVCVCVCARARAHVCTRLTAMKLSRGRGNATMVSIDCTVIKREEG